MQATSRLSSDIAAYDQWRQALVSQIQSLSNWMQVQELGQHEQQQTLNNLLLKLADDTLNIAFVAEFSRGKSELINAIFFAEYGQRMMPSSAGRTTMCPTELSYQAQHAPSIALLPIETKQSNTSLADYKRQTDAWHITPLDIDSADAMQTALAQVGQTKRVSIEDAKALGLYQADSTEHTTLVDEHNTLEVPVWRHALINFPHPLLEKGLVILDTPGLNAIGTEPELTLNLLPNAHAILFILAADAGVTQSDAQVWRQHIAQKQHAPSGRLVVLNKIDGLWDELKSPTAIQAEIHKQVQTTANILGIPSSQIYPVSAQKALVAKIQQNSALLEKSRIRGLETALSEQLLPTKHAILREQASSHVEEATQDIQSILNTRKHHLQQQIKELHGLRGKNHEIILRTIHAIEIEKAKFDKGMMRFQALRSVYTKQSNQLLGQISIPRLKTKIADTQEKMKQSRFSFGEMGLSGITTRFFADLHSHFEAAKDTIAEISSMMEAMHAKFHKDYGLETSNLANFSLYKYQQEMVRLEAMYHTQIGGWRNLITTSQSGISQRFFETISRRIVYVYERANQEIDSWLKNMISPLEAKIKEHQIQLKRRLESIKRIHKATDTLESRLADLNHSQNEVNEQTLALEALLNTIYHSLRNTPSHKP